MRVTLLVVFVSIFLASAFLPTIIVFGGGNPEELKSEHDRQQMLAAKNPFERSVNKAFLWFAEHRALFAWPSALGVVLALLWPA